MTEAAATPAGEQTCASYLADAIVGTGCGTVFALAGATHAPLLFALEDRGVAIVGGRHESGTVGAADGYARRTGRTGFALIVAEQGLANAMTALAAMGVPVLGNGLGRGLAPEVAPTGYPWPYAQRAANQADLVIVVGARMNMWFGYGLAPRFGAEARFIHIDSSAEAIGRNTAVDLALVADPGRTLAALVEGLNAAQFSRDPAWIAEALAPRAQCVEALLESYGDGLHSASIGAALDAILPEERVLVCDGADSMNFTYAKMRVHRPRSYSNLLPFGAMGAGFPLAVGMAAAEAETALREGRAAKPVAFVTGDGSLGFFLAEIDTLARSALPLTVLVANDGKWGTEYHGQQLVYGRTSNTDLNGVDYAAIAGGFGCPAKVATTRGELDAAIAQAHASAGPMLIDVRVDPDSGRIRKAEPLLAMILFEDIPHS